MTNTQGSTRPIRWSILWAVLLMGLAVPVLASQVREASSATGEAAALLAETVTLQQGLDGYAGAADAYLRSGVLEENNGGTSALKIGRKGETYNALLRFDLQGYIPSSAAVLTATLHLYPYDSDLASPMTMEAYRALVPWEELEANWNVRAAGLPWAGPGSSGEGVDYAGGAVGSASVLDTGVWYALDVTAAVSAWVRSEANHGLLLLASPDSLPANTFYFRTREYVSVDQRPRLVITYDASGPTPSPTETLTPTTSPTATETGEPGVTPSASPTQDPRRTPLPDSLYPYPELRAGVVVFNTFGLPLASLNTKLIKLEDRGPNWWDSRLGMDSITVILEDTTRYELPDPQTFWEGIRTLVADNPGHTWFVGNEPENPCRLATSFSGDYVQRYYKMYHFIKDVDPTARVGIGGVVLPSQIRRDWLDNVLSGYQSRYGEPMPIDIWNVHDLLLSECPGSCGCQDPNPYPSLCCSGGYVPREFWPRKGEYYSQADQARFDEFQRLLVEFRQWMKDRGFRDKELIVTEMGVLAPTVQGGCPWCFSHETINQFMYDAFEWMHTARDTETGMPADGYRLVQRWTWYSLDDRSFNGSLLDRSWRLTDFGLNFANYLARFLPRAPTTIFFQKGWTGYNDNGDTSISPTAARPGMNIMAVGADGQTRGLLQFDLTVLPTDVEVISATLSLRTASHSNVGDMTVGCYGVLRPWETASATWADATSGTTWEVPGCAGESDHESTPVDSQVIRADQITYQWDVTRLAQGWVADPASNHGLLLLGQAAGSGTWSFYSSDQPEQSPYWMHRYRPKLELVVQAPLQAATETPTATPTSTETPTPTASVSPADTPTASVTVTVTPTGTPTGPAVFDTYLPVIRKP